MPLRSGRPGGIRVAPSPGRARNCGVRQTSGASTLRTGSAGAWPDRGRSGPRPWPPRPRSSPNGPARSESQRQPERPESEGRDDKGAPGVAGAAQPARQAPSCRPASAARSPPGAAATRPGAITSASVVKMPRNCGSKEDEQEAHARHERPWTAAGSRSRPASARSGSRAPRPCPTRVVAATEKPKPGMYDSDSLVRASWCAAKAAVPSPATTVAYAIWPSAHEHHLGRRRKADVQDPPRLDDVQPEARRDVSRRPDSSAQAGSGGSARRPPRARRPRRWRPQSRQAPGSARRRRCRTQETTMFTPFTIPMTSMGVRVSPAPRRAAMPRNIERGDQEGVQRGSGGRSVPGSMTSAGALRGRCTPERRRRRRAWRPDRSGRPSAGIGAGCDSACCGFAGARSAGR